MLIRSQHKKKITNFNKVTDIVIHKNDNGKYKITACYSFYDGEDIGNSPLGEYTTEEKAIKVLDMIQEKYEAYIKASSDSFYFAFYPPRVFQMPQEEEVEA